MNEPSSLRRTLVVAALAVAFAAQARAQGGAQGGPGGGAVPVTVATVSKRDVPVLERAVGTVQPLRSVVVRARVDGTLDQVLFTEGQEVEPGDVLAQIDPRPYKAVLDQALARKAASEAQLALARTDLTRTAELAQTGSAPRQRLDLQRAQVLQAEAAVQGDEAAIAAAALNLGFTRVVSPIAGRVGLRQVDPGNLVRASDGTGIATVTQLQPISVVFTLPQDALPRVKAAMREGTLSAEAYSSDDRERLAGGELLTFDNAIDSGTGTIRLKASFPNADRALWPGQFVNVRLRLEVREGAPTVPSTAVQRGQDKLYVFVVKPDGTAIVRPVELAQDDGHLAVVRRGLEGGERVVVSGQSRLTDGSRVAASEQPGQTPGQGPPGQGPPGQRSAREPAS